MPVSAGAWPSNTLMARLGERTRQELLALTPPREHAAGSVLIRQGEPGSDVYLLRSARPQTSACVKVAATLENGDECLLGISVSGDVVGDLAALRTGARSATVTTCTSALIHRIPQKLFAGFLERHPDAWRELSYMIADRLDWANRRRLEFASYDVPVRLARVMVELFDRHGFRGADGYELGVWLSQVELGKLISAREDAVRKAARRLRDDGLVMTHYRRVVITDLSGMREFAELA
jgi:CRP/FNR family cyclic AMP-dependent transcriptional regulator